MVRKRKKTANKKKNGKKDVKKLTVQQTIAYKEMGRDGICRVQGNVYSKCIRFYDINYQLAQNEDKNAIFENWCDFLNYFDSSIHFQLSFINHKSSMKEFEQVIKISPQGDAYDDIRMEYANMLKKQLARGNNGLVKTKYITFSIEAENIREAKPKLERIESDILNNFKILGVMAYPLNGEERLRILYETFNPDSTVEFQFDYGSMIKTGLNTKDYIAPTSFVFKDGKTFQMGNTMGAVSYLQILAPELSMDTWWYYKAAHLIDQSWSVRAAGLRQRHIDQAQSMNLYITNDYSMRQVLRLYLEAWRAGVKTIYYVRSKALEVETCESCSS